jgi:hypothetical protein
MHLADINQPIKHVKWSGYNQSLARHGEILIGFYVVDNLGYGSKRDEQGKLAYDKLARYLDN